MTHWNRPVFLFLCISLIGFELIAGPAFVRRDRVVYRVGPGTRVARSIELVHDRLLASVRRQFAEQQLSEPRSFAVFLAGDAADFQRRTGQPWYVAGLYDARAEYFFFQNPLRLRARGRLNATIDHEVCHQLVASYRRHLGKARWSRRTWLEESYCEALYPGGEDCPGDPRLNRRVRELPDADAFGRLLDDRGSAKAARRSRCLARWFGADLIAQAGRENGRRRAFALVTGDVPDQSEAAIRARLDRALERFKRRFE